MASATAQRVARNTLWFTMGSILQKGISFVYFTVVAMAFGVTGTGRYFFALTFTALFAMVADWGISAMLTREIAKDRAVGERLIVPAFLMKGGFALATGVLITVLARAFGYPAETRMMVALATVVLLLDSIHLGCYGILRGLQRVHYEASGLVIGQAVLTIVGGSILFLRGGLSLSNIPGAPPLTLTRTLAPIWLLVPYVCTSIVNITIAAIGMIRERVRMVWAPSEWRDRIRRMLHMATPFALAGILARVYTYSDTFLLSILAVESAVGFYSTPFKIAFAFQFIPLAFMGALYPAMSAVANRSREELRSLFEQSLRALFAVALPISVGIAILAPRIITELYGAAFAPSIIPLTILAVSIPFVFANFPAGNLLNATDRQSWNTILVGIATAVNLLANVLLIPPYAVIGAAVSALIGSVALTIANAVLAHRVIAYRLRIVGRALLRTLLACVVMGIVLLMLPSAPLLAAVAVGGVVYAGAAFSFRAIQHSDIRELLAYFRSTPTPPAPEIV
ncbi:flippase [Candidatus Uhrbacteria bacterium]|nr:flippase [Candidatus Uhrbacteria bacterium]